MDSVAVQPQPGTPWYLIHTKPRQELRALANLTQQGYHCYLPLFWTEKVQKGNLKAVEAALFPRYLFIQLSSQQEGKSWSPIRSTLGVQRLVTFGTQPAKVDAALVAALQGAEQARGTMPEKLFEPGQRVRVLDGPFAGLDAVFEMADGERRAMVLIEMLHKQVSVPLSITQIGEFV